jgi:hypothetical protein
MLVDRLILLDTPTQAANSTLVNMNSLPYPALQNRVNFRTLFLYIVTVFGFIHCYF